MHLTHTITFGKKKQLFFQSSTSQKIIKMKALATCIVPPQFILSTPLHVMPLSNATLQNQKQRYPMQETNGNNRCKNGKFKIEMGIHIKANF
jgi:hypothetical protein